MRAAGPKKGPPPLILSSPFSKGAAGDAFAIVSWRTTFNGLSRSAKTRVTRSRTSEFLQSSPSTGRRDRCRNRHGSADSASRLSPAREWRALSRAFQDSPGCFTKDFGSANRSETEHQVGLSSVRPRPDTKRSHASAASIMWRMRIASSRRILGRGCSQHLIAEVTAEILRSA
jgi:hypothetical protein